MNFNREERVEFTRQLEQIEALKAKERKEANLMQNQTSTDTQNFAYREELGMSRDIAAKKAGYGSGEQYRKEKFIVDHSDELSYR
ncbi:MAG: hypothetical protein Q4F41_09390 [Eubacteriales bacterium]|nr:hypothetical protein [Eubacteriales bacterium]